MKMSYVPPDHIDALDVGPPALDDFKKTTLMTNKHIFRISKEDLTLFFERKNLRMPDNKGECRVSLNILKACGFNDGLSRLLGSDVKTGIIGDDEDLERR